jgi:uncharacterized protein
MPAFREMLIVMLIHEWTAHRFGRRHGIGRRQAFRPCFGLPRISLLSAAVAAFFLAAAMRPAAQAAGETARPAAALTFVSPEAAYDQGLGAVRAGRPELAVTAFEFAGNNNHVPALYFLGVLFANNDDRVTDHAKAFNVFHRIVDKYAYVDPQTDFRSVYVVRAAVRLADYYRSGLPALGLKPDPREAVELLNHAATYFSDLEAQFQLAKMHLTGEGVQGNERYGLHWLSSLARKNHAGAQAFLAELLWRGKFVQKDPNQALVWSTLSLESAGDNDRIWIEEIYQTIYCGAAPGVREKAGQLVADWRRRAPATTGGTPPAQNVDRTVTPNRGASAGQTRSDAGPNFAAVRSCANGEQVPSIVPGALPMPGEGQRSEPAPLPAPMPVIDKNNPRAGAATNPSAMRSVDAPAPAKTPAFGEGFREFDKDEGAARGRR